jgi:tryptophan-rich sensory protein
MKPVNIIKLLICCAVPFLTGLMDEPFITTEAGGIWYTNLHKPFFNPPDWVFAPVWMTLYVMMGVSSFLIWQKDLEYKPVRVAMTWYIIQIILNAIWTPLFFGMQSPLLGLVDVIGLLAAIIVTIVLFFKISRLAALLLVPYLAWVSFAAVLNAAIYLLNR